MRLAPVIAAMCGTAVALLATSAGVPAHADAPVPLGGGSGIVVDGDTFCTLTTIGHDNRGKLVGFTSAHCGGPGHEVAAEGGLDAAIEHTLAELLACGPRALRTQKALLRAWEEPHIERGIKESVAAFGASYDSDEPAQCMEREFFSKKRR